jgi:hypothetical protein
MNVREGIRIAHPDAFEFATGLGRSSSSGVANRIPFPALNGNPTYGYWYATVIPSSA